MGFLGIAETIKFDTKGSAPGKAVIIGTSAGADQQRTSEMYHPPGISSAPTEQDCIIETQIGTGKRVSIASHNYRIEVEVNAGETIIYSTNTAGDTVQSQIKLDTDGNIELNGNDKKFVTYAELKTGLDNLITALNSHIHTSAAPGSPTTSPVTPLMLDISAAETTTLKTGG